jgi:hypothetical protein
MLAPQWTKLKIGPLLRGEKDKRYYTDLFSSRSYVRGLRRWLWLATAARIAERDAEHAVGATESGRELAVFRDMQGMYEPLIGHQEFLHRRLLEIVTPRNRQLIDDSPAPYIAVHVRRGDVVVIDRGKAWDQSMGWLGLPEDWFVRAIAQLRALAGWEVPVTVFTDAYENQIPAILSLPSVTVAPQRPAIVDILVMATARVLIPTTSSTFSMWAAFLGEMPVVWYPGQRLLPASSVRLDVETSLEGDVDPAAQTIMRDLAPAT